MTQLKNIILLDRNEYFFPHPAEVINTLKALYKENFISNYATAPQLDQLKQEIAQKYKVDKKLLLLGHGAEDIFVKILAWFRKEINTIFVEEFSWTNYLHLAEGFNYVVHAITTLEKTDKFVTNIEAFYAKLADIKTAIILITSPNNPTGHTTKICDLHQLALNYPQHIFIFDCVYAEILNADYAPLFELKNIIFIGSFSKFFGMPGLRLGYAIGCLPKAFKLNLGLGPTTIDTAFAALNNFATYQSNRNFMLNFNSYIAKKKFNNIKIYQSSAPFFLVKIADENKIKLAEELSGIRPKYIHRPDGIYLRFGLGPQEICNKIEEYLNIAMGSRLRVNDKTPTCHS